MRDIIINLATEIMNNLNKIGALSTQALVLVRGLP